MSSPFSHPVDPNTCDANTCHAEKNYIMESEVTAEQLKKDTDRPLRNGKKEDQHDVLMVVSSLTSSSIPSVGIQDLSMVSVPQPEKREQCQQDVKLFKEQETQTETEFICIAVPDEIHEKTNSTEKTEELKDAPSNLDVSSVLVVICYVAGFAAVAWIAPTIACAVFISTFVLTACGSVALVVYCLLNAEDEDDSEPVDDSLRMSSALKSWENPEASLNGEDSDDADKTKCRLIVLGIGTVMLLGVFPNVVAALVATVVSTVTTFRVCRGNETRPKYEALVLNKASDCVKEKVTWPFLKRTTRCVLGMVFLSLFILCGGFLLAELFILWLILIITFKVDVKIEDEAEETEAELETLSPDDEDIELWPFICFTVFIVSSISAVAIAPQPAYPVVLVIIAALSGVITTYYLLANDEMQKGPEQEDAATNSYQQDTEEPLQLKTSQKVRRDLKRLTSERKAVVGSSEKDTAHLLGLPQAANIIVVGTMINIQHMETSSLNFHGVNNDAVAVLKHQRHRSI